LCFPLKDFLLKKLFKNITLINAISEEIKIGKAGVTDKLKRLFVSREEEL